MKKAIRFQPPSLAFARSALYSALAAAFDYPRAGSRDMILERLAAASGLLKDTGWAAIHEGMRAAERELRRIDDEGLERKYLRVFTHVCAADANPCESSYLCKHLFQVSQRMANLAGFYRAFGVEPTGERHDHASVEMEFLAFLAFREAAEESPELAQEMAKAQRLFLERHLGRWLPTFAELVSEKADEGPIAAFAQLAGRFVSADCARMGITFRAPRTARIPLPITEEPTGPGIVLSGRPVFSQGGQA